MVEVGRAFEDLVIRVIEVVRAVEMVRRMEVIMVV